MELRSILTADHLDIIFDGRNKTYGGYELRKNYSRRATKAITLVLSAAVLLIGAHAIASGLKPDEVVTLAQVERTIEMQDLTPDIPDPPPPPMPPEPVPPAPSLVWTPPVIVENEDVPEPPPTQEELKDKVISTVKVDGEPGGSDITPPIIGGGTGPATGVVTAPPPPPEAPMEYVDQMPEFNGNVSEYLARNIQYPVSAREAGISGKVTIQFVVNEDGSISNAKVLRGIGGGCEEEAIRVINAMPKWKAGKSNGKAVKVFFRLPVTFKMH